jgi:hypothetical protein
MIRDVFFHFSRHEILGKANILRLWPSNEPLETFADNSRTRWVSHESFCCSSSALVTQCVARHSGPKCFKMSHIKKNKTENPSSHCAMSSERDSFAKGIFSTFAKGFLLHKLLLKVNYSLLRVKKSRSHDMGHYTLEPFTSLLHLKKAGARCGLVHGARSLFRWG